MARYDIILIIFVYFIGNDVLATIVRSTKESTRFLDGCSLLDCGRLGRRESRLLMADCYSDHRLSIVDWYSLRFRSFVLGRGGMLGCQKIVQV